MIDHRISPIERYFASRTGDLPVAMTSQLQLRLEALLHDRTVSPRQRARDPQTARLHIMAVAPIVQVWAAAGLSDGGGITAVRPVADRQRT